MCRGSFRRRGTLLVPLCVALALFPGVAAADDPAAGEAPAPAAAADHAIPRPYPWAARIRQARRTADRRQGRIGFAVIDEHGAMRGGQRLHQGFRSASVVKVVMMICYLNHRRVRNRRLRARDRALLEPMITRSANEPASYIYTHYGAACITRAARRAGLEGFTTERFWGKSRLTPVGVARMFRRVDTLIPQRHRAYAMRLLANVIPVQRWGLPPSTPTGWTIRLKGGWAGTVINQGAMFEKGSRQFTIAVLTNGNPSHAYGHATIKRIGAKLLRDYNAYSG